MFNLWVKTYYIGTLLGLFVLLKVYIGFRNPEKVLNKAEKFDKEKMVEYLNLYIKRNTYLALIAIILISILAVFTVLFR